MWRLGEAGRSVLLVAANSSDREIARQAKELLNRYVLGVDAKTPQQTARIIKFFHDGNDGLKGSLLNKLARDNKFHLLYRLLEQVEDKEQQESLYNDVFGLNDFLIRLVQAERWAEIEFMLTHPLTRKFDTMIYVYYQKSLGRIQQLSDQFQEELTSSSKNGSDATDEQIIEWVAILRIQRRFDEATKFAQELKDDSARTALTRQILMESGNWKAIADNMILPGEPVAEGDSQFAFSLAQQAVIFHFNEDKAKVRDALNQLKAIAKAFEDDHQDIEAKAARRRVVEVALSVMDVETASDFFEESDRLEVFTVLNILHRYDDAFDAIGLGSGLEDRIEWFGKQVRILDSLRQQIRRAEESNEDSDDQEINLRDTWRLCCNVASQLGSFGFTQESCLHYRTLFASLDDVENVLDQKIDVLEGLIDLGEFEEAWLVIDRGFSDSEHRILMGSIFEYKSEQATFWYQTLKFRYPDAQERLRVVASLVNSPMKLGSRNEQIPIDLDAEFAAARTTIKSPTGLLEFNISELLKFHGRNSESQQYLLDATSLLNRNAMALSAAGLMEEGKFKQAVSVYEEPSAGPNSTYNLMQTAEALREIGRDHEAALRETMAFVVWDNSYRSDTIIGDFQRQDKLGQLVNFFQVYVCAPGNTRISNERYRRSLASAMRNEAPKYSAINMQILLLEMHNNDSPGMQRLIYWADAPLQIMMAKSRALLNRGEFGHALKLLLEGNDFRPGDPGIGEEFLPTFASAGKHELAAQLLAAVSEFYFDALQRFPASPIHHNNFAWIYACGGHQLSSAKRHSEKAVSLRPQTSSYLDTYAEICFLIGDRAQAIEYARKCVQLNPQKLHYQKQLKRFQSDGL